MSEKKPKTLPVNVKNNYLYRGFDELPFYYLDKETKPTMTWMCNYDHNKKITSVVEHLESKEKMTKYFDTLEEAKEARNALIRDGWLEGQLPNIEVNQENWDALPRQQKRRIQRSLMKQAIREGRKERKQQEEERKRYEERKKIRELRKKLEEEKKNPED